MESFDETKDINEEKIKKLLSTFVPIKTYVISKGIAYEMLQVKTVDLTPTTFYGMAKWDNNFAGKVPKKEKLKCPPHIYDNAKVVVRDGKLKTISKCAYCPFELIF